MHVPGKYETRFSENWDLEDLEMTFFAISVYHNRKYYICVFKKQDIWVLVYGFKILLEFQCPKDCFVHQ